LPARSEFELPTASPLGSGCPTRPPCGTGSVRLQTPFGSRHPSQVIQETIIQELTPCETGFVVYTTTHCRLDVPR